MAAHAGHLEKAAQFVEDGEKCLKKKSWFLNNTTKNEDAADFFDKGARYFKIARDMKNAADTYMRAAEQYEIVKSDHERARAYVEAAKCYKEVDTKDALHAFQQAIEVYRETGRLQQAGKMLVEVGEIHQEERDYAEAVATFEDASDYLAGEGSTSQANACLLKVASMLSKDMDPPDLLRAASIFERLGRSSMEKKLLQMNAKQYWLQSVLCYLAQGDTVAARTKQSEFTDMDYTFEDSREYKFLDTLIKASEDLNVETFSQCCFDYDQISKLDPWKTKMCLRIKRSIEASAGGDGEDDLEEEVNLM